MSIDIRPPDHKGTQAPERTIPRLKQRYRDEFAATFSQLARVMRQGNSETLVAFLLDGAEDRARAAAERARR